MCDNDEKPYEILEFPFKTDYISSFFVIYLFFVHVESIKNTPLTRQKKKNHYFHEIHLNGFIDCMNFTLFLCSLPK